MVTVLRLPAQAWLQKEGSSRRSGNYLEDKSSGRLEEKSSLSAGERSPSERSCSPGGRLPSNRSSLESGSAATLFALGFGTQLLYGFGLSFPFNLLLLPLTAVEWILRWQITLQGAPSVEGGAAMG